MEVLVGLFHSDCLSGTGFILAVVMIVGTMFWKPAKILVDRTSRIATVLIPLAFVCFIHSLIVRLRLDSTC